jgi:mono/diheme cytochrome c family protein
MTIELRRALAPFIAVAICAAAPASAGDAAKGGAEKGDAAKGGAEKGDAAKGGVIAKRWCAACHVVASDQTTASADAPPFADIAARRPNAKQLAAFLIDPHPKMPNMNLTRKEIADIVAYIHSLDPKTPPPEQPGKEKELERPNQG